MWLPQDSITIIGLRFQIRVSDSGSSFKPELTVLNLGFKLEFQTKVVVSN